MPDNPQAISFLARCERWVCDGYSVDIRYIATKGPASQALFDALILLNPLPHSADNRLSLSLATLLAGQVQTAAMGKRQILAIIGAALDGTITVHGQDLTLPKEGPYRFQSPSSAQDTWFMPLALQVHGSAPTGQLDLASIDNALRAAAPPFDGVEDLRAWLGLRLPDSSSLSTISIAINPPIDIRVDESSLSGDVLRLVLHAHPKASKSQVTLAVRAVPGDGLLSRAQVADKIVWGEVNDGRIEGRAEISLSKATGALAMLLIGPDTVRRNWFLDPARAPNHRFAAVQQFDTDLRMLKRGLFEDTDSTRFETAVASMLFLLGISPAIQLETNSPDLIVVTPLGRLILVECTIRVADVQTKLGKLVDRREALLRTLRANNQGTEVVAALVCRLPRDQIAAHVNTLKAMRVVLVAAEEITTAIDRARLPVDPEAILTQALQTLEG